MSGLLPLAADSDLWDHARFGAEVGQRPADTGVEILARPCSDDDSGVDDGTRL
jgi:hypothetical protein